MPSAQPQPSSSRRRRWRALRWLAVGLLLLALAPLAAVQLLLLAPRPREFVKQKLIAVASAGLGGGRLEIDHLDALSLFQVRARGVRLLGPRGERLASVDRVEALVDPLTLWQKRLSVTSLSVSRPFADLGAPWDDGGGIQSLFRAESTQTPNPAPNQALGFDIALDALRIDHGRVELRAGGARWRIEDLNSSLRLRVGSQLTLGLAGLTASVQRDDRVVATLQGSDVSYADAGSAQARIEVVAGATRVSATAELSEPDASGAQPVRAELQARGLSPQTLASFGLDDGGILTAPIDIQARANGSMAASIGAIDWSAQLETPGGHVAVEGRWDAPLLHATLHTPRLVPARFLRPEIAALSARVRLQLQHDTASKVTSLKLELLESSYADTPLPKLEARLRLAATGELWLDSLQARYPAAQLDARGRMARDGELSLQAKLNANSLARLPPVKHLGLGLDGDLVGELELGRSASGTFTVKAGVDLARARYGDLQADALRSRVDASGPGFDRSSGTLELRATRLRNARVELPHAEISVRGGPAQYAVAGQFGDRGDLTAQLTRVGRGLRATAQAAVALHHSGARHPLKTTIGTIEYEPERAIAMRNVQFSYRSARATLEGRLEPKRKSRLEARVQIPDMAELTELWMADPISGSLHVSGAVQDSIQKPRMQVEARYRSAALRGLKNLEVDLHGQADMARRRMELRVATQSHAGAISLALKSRLRGSQLTTAAFTHGSHELDVQLDRFVPSELALWPRAAAVPTRADVSGVVRARGRLEELAISTDLRAGLRFAGDPDRLDVGIAGRYAEEKLDLTLDSRDRRGPLLDARVQSGLTRKQLSAPSDLLAQLLAAGAWEASATLHPRRLDRLPSAGAMQLPEAVAPAVVSGQLDLMQASGQDPAGKLTMRAGWESPSGQPATHAGPAGCKGNTFPELELEASVQKGILQSRLVASVSGEETFVMTSDSGTFLDKWLGTKPHALRPFQAAVTFTNLSLSQLPVVCEFVAGDISGHAEMSRPRTQQVTSSIDIRGRAIRVGEAPAFDAVIGASANRQVLDASVELKAKGGFAKVAAKLPLDGSGQLPSLKLDSPAYLEAQMRKMDVRSLLAALPHLRATQGQADADLTFTGTLREPDLRGTIVLDGVTMTIAELGQRLERTSATLTLEGRSMSFKQLKIHDRDGSLELNGGLTMRDWGSFKGEVRAKAENFPLRKSAAMLARVTGSASLDADVDPRRMAFDVTLERARIELMDEDLSGVQPLARNPRIVFTDAGERPEPGVASAESGTPLTLKVHTNAPFWVNRSDFSVLVSVQITVDATPGRMSLTGTVNLQRGYVQLMGQFFDIEQGRIDFTGGHDVEPMLDLVASRKLSDGTKIGIKASGTLRSPKIEFTREDETVTAGEALSAASGSHYGGSDATVEQQVSSMASGLAASILNLGARPEAGGLMPTLSLGASEHGPTLRAGLEADQFIPGFLKHIVIDAYVEGIFSREDGAVSNGQASSDTAGSAALLELRFPHSLVSEAQYGPSKRWSFDLSWQP